jgi:uncharacterized protein YndB with AHSA1/START domain
MAAVVAVSTTVQAEPGEVYSLVADLARMREWSPEAATMTWLDGATEPKPGAKFRGANSRGRFYRWHTLCEVVTAEPGRGLGWRSTYLGMSVAVWRYDVEGDGAGGTALTETWEDERGLAMKVIGFIGTGVADRATHNAATMRTTLERIKATAEGAGGAGGQKET